LKHINIAEGYCHLTVTLTQLLPYKPPPPLSPSFPLLSVYAQIRHREKN
jgi:hypothetical protein